MISNQEEVNWLRKQLQDKEEKIKRLKEEKKAAPVREVKIETVVVEKPVEVERIREKVITVEKIVKEYIQPERPVVVQEVTCGPEPQQADDEEIARLEEALHKRGAKLKALEAELLNRDNELRNEQTYSKELLSTIEKYKHERQKLVNIIAEKNA